MSFFYFVRSLLLMIHFNFKNNSSDKTILILWKILSSDLNISFYRKKIVTTIGCKIQNKQITLKIIKEIIGKYHVKC